MSDVPIAVRERRCEMTRKKDKGTYDFSFVIENLTQKEADDIGDIFIRAVEKYNGRAGGGFYRIDNEVIITCCKDSIRKLKRDIESLLGDYIPLCVDHKKKSLKCYSCGAIGERKYAKRIIKDLFAKHLGEGEK